MVASLAGFYQRVPVGHVEAGLRTHDRYSPFPEEINRRIISVVATYHFAPTRKSLEALLAEGIAPDQVFLTGNTVVDALAMTLQKPCHLDLKLAEGRRLLLVTAHRRENFGKPLENICQALGEIVQRNPDVELVYPVHLNPNVKGPVRRLLGGRPRIHLIEPLGYAAFAHLMSRAYLILTDSGGIQEEAPFLGKPVLVMRRETERPEAIEAGTARLVGTDPKTIVAQAELLLHNLEEYRKMSQAASPFGDGRAAERIVRVLLSRLGSEGAGEDPLVLTPAPG